MLIWFSWYVFSCLYNGTALTYFPHMIDDTSDGVAILFDHSSTGFCARMIVWLSFAAYTPIL